jgi:hypothetical protein
VSMIAACGCAPGSPGSVCTYHGRLRGLWADFSSAYEGARASRSAGVPLNESTGTPAPIFLSGLTVTRPRGSVYGQDPRLMLPAVTR